MDPSITAGRYKDFSQRLGAWHSVPMLLIEGLAIHQWNSGTTSKTSWRTAMRVVKNPDGSVTGSGEGMPASLATLPIATMPVLLCGSHATI